MIEEDYTDFELSKKLKEIGFPQWNDNPEEYHPYVEGYDYDGHDTNIFSSNRKLEYSKVPLSLVQKWLREEKELHILPIIVQTPTDNLYSVHVYDPHGEGMKYPSNNYINTESSYEEALFVGINRCIELLKEKKNHEKGTSKASKTS